MPILYIKTDCPYSAQVREEAKRMNVELQECNIADPEHHKVLMARGGKEQTPFLLDEKTGAGLYESDRIVSYLEETYAKKG